MSDDARRMVAAGYDEVADEYVRWTSGSPLRLRQLEALLSSLPANARVLDLGCGAGVPLAPFLTDRGHRVVGVDGSKRQIALARENEPRGEFIVADMTTVEFDPESFIGEEEDGELVSFLWALSCKPPTASAPSLQPEITARLQAI